MSDFTLLYAESLDAWILQTSEEENEQGKLEGIVLFISKGLSKQEQVDNLLDLILKKDKNQEYYKEILRIITH